MYIKELNKTEPSDIQPKKKPTKLEYLSYAAIHQKGRVYEKVVLFHYTYLTIRAIIFGVLVYLNGVDKLPMLIEYF